MRVVVMGTPEYAVSVLRGMISSGIRPVGVYTQPDKPAGRGLEGTMSSVKRCALKEGLAVFQPSSLVDHEAQRTLEVLKPDVIVVAAYGKILPPGILRLPQHGCLNVHPSLLPRHRGPSPVVTAILQGDTGTGVSVMLLDEGVDSGPVVAQKKTGIGPDETADALTRRLFHIGGDLLAEVLVPWCKGEVEAVPQDSSQASTTRKIKKSDGEVDWGAAAAELARRIRAFDPWPGVFTYWKGRLLKIVEARVVHTETLERPGTVISIPDRPQGVGVVTGAGVLELIRLQLEGKRAVGAEEFVRGQRDFLGARLPSW